MRTEQLARDAGTSLDGPTDRDGAGWRPAQAVLVAASFGATAWLVASGVGAMSGRRTTPWLFGRAGGITAYALLVTVVASGLVLSHPARTRVRWPSSTARVRLHLALSVGTLAFTVLHVVALALDSYAGVGWAGTLLPLASRYRPVPVALGVVGLWAGLLAGLTAGLAGRVPVRLWWSVHKGSAGCLVLVWVHTVLAGSDSTALVAFYLVSGAAVVGLAVSRYTSRRPAEL